MGENGKKLIERWRDDIGKRLKKEKKRLLEELLKSFAGMLDNTVDNGGRAYRQGGDEFAVLYKRDAQEFVWKLEQKCKVQNMSRSVPISYAIGYCKLSDKDFINVVDTMMYANKRRMKQQRQS